jgi:HK97 family phage prohead protease
MKTKKENETKIIKPDIVFHAEIKQAKPHLDDEEEDFIIEGFASTEDVDRGSDITHAEAFSKTLKDFMDNPILLFMHDLRRPIGKVIEATVKKGKGLFVRASISKTEEEIREKIKERVLRAFSFGFVIKSSNEEERNKQTIRHLTDVDMFEISVVSIPMNRRALFSLAKALETGTDLIYSNDYVESLEKSFEKTSEDIDIIKQQVDCISILKNEIKSFDKKLKTILNEELRKDKNKMET